MAARGLMVFRRVLRRGRLVIVEASEVGGGTVLLHVEGRRRNRLFPGLVCRPYRLRKAKPPRRRKGGKQGP
jgi:hypothetical protein